MRKMKKVAVLCLTAAMTMSLLAGCGGTKKNADGETTEVTTEAESTEEEETTTEKATEEETEEPTTEALGVSDVRSPSMSTLKPLLPSSAAGWLSL